jgi:hypothetical protein
MQASLAYIRTYLLVLQNLCLDLPFDVFIHPKISKDRNHMKLYSESCQGTWIMFVKAVSVYSEKLNTIDVDLDLLHISLCALTSATEFPDYCDTGEL